MAGDAVATTWNVVDTGTAANLGRILLGRNEGPPPYTVYAAYRADGANLGGFETLDAAVAAINDAAVQGQAQVLAQTLAQLGISGEQATAVHTQLGIPEPPPPPVPEEVPSA